MKTFSIIFFITGLIAGAAVLSNSEANHTRDVPALGMLSFSEALISATCFLCAAFLMYKGSEAEDKKAGSEKSEMVKEEIPSPTDK